MKYRPEIDGLRAVAVLPVILFHAGFSIADGGFLGVDVFFVISGYLITSILLNDLEANRYSIARFYERRARRILPALFVVLAVCAVFALAWMPPDEFVGFSESLISVVAFLSNVYFWRSTDYFSTAAELNPLLHTWSLAVEEQFYIIYPLILVAIARFGRRALFSSIVAMILLSFGLNLIALNSDAVSSLAVFFLTPFRVWELLAGAACALIRPRMTLQSSAIFSLVGLMAIILSFVAFDRATPSPSHYTMLPVVGTVLLILFCKQNDPVGRLLASRPLVGIGLISYSAYLWHQPLFAFARLRSLREPSMELLLALACLSLVLAWVTWKFVENPIRFGRVPGFRSGRGILFSSLTAGAVVLGMGMFGVVSNGLPKRFPQKLLADIKAQHNPYQSQCLHGSPFVKEHPRPGCADFAVNGTVDVVFVGDSHADSISFPAQELLLEEGIGSYAVFYYTCPPIAGLSIRPFLPEHKCDEYNNQMVSYAREIGARTLVLSGRFTQYLEGNLFDNGEGGVEIRPVEMMDAAWSSEMGADPNDVERVARVSEQFRAGLEQLTKEFNVVLVYPIPEVGWDVPRMLLFREFYGDSAIAKPLTTAYSAYETRNARVIEIFDSIKSEKLRRVKPSHILCNSEIIDRCITENDGRSYYFDDDHLSLTGAELLAPTIVDAVRSFD